MKVVKTNISGQPLKSELKAFGGAYNFWGKFINNGVGSPKVIYEKGLDLFDGMDRGVAGETCFVSFEVLKNGLLLRLNQNQRTLCAGLEFDELKAIDLTGFRIEVRERKLRKTRIRIVHRGDLTIREETGGSTSFSVVVHEFETLKSFFGKPVFAGKFNFNISDAPPESSIDYPTWFPEDT